MKAEIAVVGHDYGPLAKETGDHYLFVDMMDIEGDEQFVYQFQQGVERIHCAQERKKLYAHVNTNV